MTRNARKKSASSVEIQTKRNMCSSLCSRMLCLVSARTKDKAFEYLSFLQKGILCSDARSQEIESAAASESVLDTVRVLALTIWSESVYCRWSGCTSADPMHDVRYRMRRQFWYSILNLGPLRGEDWQIGGGTRALWWTTVQSLWEMPKWIQSCMLSNDELLPVIAHSVQIFSLRSVLTRVFDVGADTSFA